MSTPKVEIVSESCDVDGERYRAVKLEDGTYVLITGHVPVTCGQPLPIDPGTTGTIGDPCDLSALRTEWEQLDEVSGDHKSAERMLEVWAAFEREALAVPTARRLHQIV
jgi:hypothetical protein